MRESKSQTQTLLVVLMIALAAPTACKKPPLRSREPARTERRQRTEPMLRVSFPPGTPRERSQRARDLWPVAQRYARRYRLDPVLVMAIIWVESRFDPQAKSHAGATGLMQLMPRTAKALRDKLDLPATPLSDPAHNIQLGCYYYARLLRRFRGRRDLSLAAYNAGPARVKRWRKGKGLPSASRNYVRSVLKARAFFRPPPLAR